MSIEACVWDDAQSTRGDASSGVSEYRDRNDPARDDEREHEGWAVARGEVSRNHDEVSCIPHTVFLNFTLGCARAHRKLSGEKLSVLLRELRSYLDELPDHLDEVHKVQQRVTTTALLLEDDREGDEGAQTADEFGNWLVGYFQSVFFFSLPAVPQIS